MIIVLNWLILIMTFGLVQIADVEYIDNDTAISELHNHSLNDIFRDGNAFSDATFDIDTSEWADLNYSGIDVQNNHVNNEMEMKTVPNYHKTKIRSDVGNVYTKNHVMFLSMDIKSYDLDNMVLWDGYAYRAFGNITGTSTNDILNTGEYHTMDKVYTIPNTANNYKMYIETYAYEPVSPYAHNIEYHWSMDNVYLVDLTALNISHVSREVLRDWLDLYEKNIAFDYDYTLNTLDMTHVTIIVGSFFLWTWLYKFLKGVIL